WQEQTKNQRLAERDGLTPPQRFFVGFAQWACSNDRPENLRVNAIVDPHSPPQARINGVVVNMPEFAAAFSCKATAKLVKKPQDPGKSGGVCAKVRDCTTPATDRRFPPRCSRGGWCAISYSWWRCSPPRSSSACGAMSTTSICPGAMPS